MTPMPRIAALALAVGLLAPAAFARTPASAPPASADAGYQLPPPALRAIVDAPRRPTFRSARAAICWR